MTQYAAYFDDSKSRAEGIVAVAGYVAPVDFWEQHFRKAWSGVLVHRDLREFKAADCRHGTESFRNWSKLERNELTERLVSVIVDPSSAPMVGVGAAVVVGSSYDPAVWPRSEQLAYLLCFIAVIVEALAACDLGPDDSVQFVFDAQKGLEGTARLLFELAQAEIESAFTGSIAGLEFADSAGCHPIQAADLLAYETYKEMKNRSERPPRRPSGALQRLVNGRLHIAHYYDLEVLAKLGEAVQAGRSAVKGSDLPQIQTIYDATLREVTQAAVKALAGHSNHPSPMLKRSPEAWIAQRGTIILQAIGDLQDAVANLHEQGVLTISEARVLMTALVAIASIGGRLSDALRAYHAPQATNGSAVLQCLGELADAVSTFTHGLPSSVAATSSKSVVAIQIEIAAIQGRVDLRRGYDV